VLYVFSIQLILLFILYSNDYKRTLPLLLCFKSEQFSYVEVFQNRRVRYLRRKHYAKSFIHPSTHTSIRSFISLSYYHSSVHPFTNSLIRPPIHSFFYPFIHLSIHAPILTSIQPCICPCTHKFIYSFNNPNQPFYSFHYWFQPTDKMLQVLYKWSECKGLHTHKREKTWLHSRSDIIINPAILQMYSTWSGI